MFQMAERKTIQQLLEEYNSTGKRPRKNQFKLDEIEDYVKSINETEWYDDLYLKLVHIQNGKPLPLSKNDIDEIRTVFLEKYFPKLEWETIKTTELTEKEKKEKSRYEEAQERAKKRALERKSNK